LLLRFREPRHFCFQLMLVGCFILRRRYADGAIVSPCHALITPYGDVSLLMPAHCHHQQVTTTCLSLLLVVECAEDMPLVMSHAVYFFVDYF